MVFEAIDFDVMLKALNTLVEEMLPLNCSLVPCGFKTGISVFETLEAFIDETICLLLVPNLILPT